MAAPRSAGKGSRVSERRRDVALMVAGVLIGLAGSILAAHFLSGTAAVIAALAMLVIGIVLALYGLIDFRRLRETTRSAGSTGLGEQPIDMDKFDELRERTRLIEPTVVPQPPPFPVSRPISNFGAGSPESGLREKLMGELAKGMTLRRGIPSLFGGNVLVAMGFGLKTTEADIIEWEDHVGLILKGHPRKHIRFFAEMKQGPFGVAVNAMNMLTSPLERQMDHRLKILETLVQELD